MVLLLWHHLAGTVAPHRKPLPSLRTHRHLPIWARVVVCAVAITSVYAQEPPDASPPESASAVDQIVIWGRSTRLLGSARSASEGVVGDADFSTRPLLRVGELTEVVPGMVATAHSGTGKANQYFLRGINLDHGTDFAGYLDGVPVNMRSHAHAQGYLDLNFIIPELIQRVEYRKGTYHADTGDFAAAGAAFFRTYDRLDRGFMQLRAGTEDHLRFIAADSIDIRDGSLLYAGEAETSDGPWELSEDVRKLNGFAKYTDMPGRYRRTLQVSVYDSEWRATDQIPQRAVADGTLSRFGFVDPDLGGESTRVNVSAGLTDEPSAFTLYATWYSLNLFSNPTYRLSDPVNGDEIEQEDRRWIAGGSASFKQELKLGGRPFRTQWGGELRYDDVSELNLFNTAARSRIGVVRADEVQELSGALHVSGELFWTDRLRTTAGLRADAYEFDVTSALSANSGDGSASIVSPKLSAAYAINEQFEMYASYGRGFHSNDVRGVTISVDPVTGDPAEAVPALVRANGTELGLRWEYGSSLRAALSVFRLDLRSELQFVGDAGTSEPKGASERHGVELTGFWQPVRSLVFDINAARTHARFRDDAGGGTHIPNALESVIGAGATWVSPRGITASLRVRHLGPSPLIEDNSVRAPSTTLVNFGTSYDFGRWQVGLEMLNLLDEKANDIAYYFESQLPWESAPVEDLHFHPVEPFEVRASVKLSY
jgi:outer membrane receptor for ferrienterochelin and colicin